MNKIVMPETNEEIPKEPTIRFDPHYHGGPALVCDCGWVARHNRKKVLIQKIARHTFKTGHEYKEKS